MPKPTMFHCEQPDNVRGDILVDGVSIGNKCFAWDIENGVAFCYILDGTTREIPNGDGTTYNKHNALDSAAVQCAECRKDSLWKIEGVPQRNPNSLLFERLYGKIEVRPIETTKETNHD